MSKQLSEAVAAIKAGDKVTAENILSNILDKEPNHEGAWLWMSKVVKTNAEKQECLNKVLEINPDNDVARQALTKLKERASLKKTVKAEKATGSGGLSLFQIGVLVILVLILCTVFGGIGATILFLSQSQPVASNQPPVQVAALAPEATPTPKPPTPTATYTRLPTATPRLSAACRADLVYYISEMDPLIDEYIDTFDLASSMPRISLAPIIQDMQRIRREMERVPVPSCAREAAGRLLAGVEIVNEAFIEFAGDGNEDYIQGLLDEGFLQIENGMAQLVALQNEEATPVAKNLPTATPTRTPTPRPTPTATLTPLPAGSKLRVDDWEVEVTRVDILRELKGITGNVERASGRFAVLFLRVTNRGLSTDTFIPMGNLELRDLQGRAYEENFVASGYAEYQYDTDLTGLINPDETVITIAVFDIPPTSGNYILKDGFSASSNSSGVLVPIQ